MGARLSRSDAATGNFSLLSRKVVDAFIRLQDQHRHYLALLQWLGFSTGYVDVDHRERHSGKSSYSFRRLVFEAVNGITTQSNLLLHVSIAVGFFFFVASMTAAAYVVVAYYVHGFAEGWASVFTLILCSTGLILMSLGVIGVYIGKVFHQVRGRPLYVVREGLNLDCIEEGAPAPDLASADSRPLLRFAVSQHSGVDRRPPGVVCAEQQPSSRGEGGVNGD
jgi:dolichol-phosphate mannosyltransferase